MSLTTSCIRHGLEIEVAVLRDWRVLRLSEYMMTSLLSVASTHRIACLIAINSAVYMELFDVIQKFSSVCSSNMVCTGCLAIFTLGGVSEDGGFLTSLVPDVCHRFVPHLYLALITFSDLVMQCGIDLRCALVPRGMWCRPDWFKVSVYLVMLLDGFQETLLLSFEVLVPPGGLMKMKSLCADLALDMLV